MQAAFLGLLRHANADELSLPATRYCPYCNLAAEAGGFLTTAQRGYLERCAEALAGQVRYEVLRQVERRLGENPFVTFVVIPPASSAPALPPEPDDLHREPLFCCGDEVKIQPSWQGAFHCFRCGARHRADHGV